jgi:gamma-glutamyltranspeptidase/glutathione hydrolase
LFALVWSPKTGRLHGLNASGRSGYAASLDAFASCAIPQHGPLSVSVPGVIDGWAELLERHGTITLQQALAPAIAYAEDGFPVAEIVAGQWKVASAARGDPAAHRRFWWRLRAGGRRDLSKPAAGADADAGRVRRT